MSHVAAMSTRMLLHLFVSGAHVPVPLPSLFHLRRGPLLGPILQHADDMDTIRHTFLHSNRVDAMRLLYPTLLSFNSNGEFEQVRGRGNMTGTRMGCCTGTIQ